MNTPEKHQLNIARKTLLLSKTGALILGGPNHAEARNIIENLTGRRPPILPDHGDYETPNLRIKGA